MAAVVGEPYKVTFHFLIDNEYKVPDIGSVSYTVYGNDGDVLGALQDVAIVTDSSTQSVNVETAGSSNSLAVDSVFEQRTVELSFEIDSEKFVLRNHYYVTERLNYRVYPSEVITVLGLKHGEVFEQDVDLVSAYFKLRTLVGATAFEEALSSGTITQIRANEAVKYQAALDLAQSIELKSLRKAGGDLLSYNRFEKVDFEAIKKGIARKLSLALDGVRSTATTPPGLQLSAPTDAITGA